MQPINPLSYRALYLRVALQGGTFSSRPISFGMQGTTAGGGVSALQSNLQRNGPSNLLVSLSVRPRGYALPGEPTHLQASSRQGPPRRPSGVRGGDDQRRSRQCTSC